MTDLADIVTSAFWRVNPPDADPTETREWLDAFDALVQSEGRERATFLLRKLLEHARARRVPLPPVLNTPYKNSVALADQPQFPGNLELESRISAIVRWNALAMVVRANRAHAELGGHIASYASAADLFEVGFNHFFRVEDLVYFQPHSAPGVYARAFLEGRLPEERLAHYRQETAGQGLTSYCHPYLMPEFWQFPTGSMGLGPISAIYQARFMRYLTDRGILKTEGRKVWAFPGDGEMDEPESLAGLSLAAREGLDNLTFVVNCNLQRLDGPVRGNGKIIQELEGLFRGAGWNVIKVIWAREWDDLLARDTDGVLVEKMNNTLDGEFQKYSVAGGAYIREHFFGPDPRLRKLVEQLSDDDLVKLRRGGHDYRKVYAAYKAATEYTGAPTVILAKKIKGWTLGPGVEGRNITHQAKKLSEAELRIFRDRIELPIPDDKLKDAPYYHPGPDSEEVDYLRERRRALGGPLPRRVVRAKPLTAPAAEIDKEFEAGSEIPVSTTMAFTRLLRNLMRDKTLGSQIVPIIPDEARTFGMDPLFKEVGIYASLGQRYEPVDSELILSYREAKDGQVLEEGITEAGSMASLQAAGTSYATHGLTAIPFYIFYSMFGFQRTGDQIWAFGDARGRGFLCGATAGRTTLNGEGLQHEDGHSHVLATAIPNIRAYDPAFAYETAVIVRDGIKRMLVDGEDIFYYLTLYNENYPQPPMPEGVEEGIVRGIYLFRPGDEGRRRRVTLLGSGSIMRQVLHAQEVLQQKYDVSADVYSVTSFQQLRNEALTVERWNRLHPESEPRIPLVTSVLGGHSPIVAASDWLKAVPDQVARWVGSPFVPLGTDGFGRSDTREALRRHFEIDAESIATASLHALALCEQYGPADVAKAIAELGIDPAKPEPRTT